MRCRSMLEKTTSHHGRQLVGLNIHAHTPEIGFADERHGKGVKAQLSVDIPQLCRMYQAAHIACFKTWSIGMLQLLTNIQLP